MTWANASFDSPSGLIEVAWKRENNQLRLQITVPPNTVAELQLQEKDAINIKVKSEHIKENGVKDGYNVFKLSPGKYML